MKIEIKCYNCGEYLEGEIPPMCSGTATYIHCKYGHGVQIFAGAHDRITIDSFELEEATQ